ncbi:MAG TPA: cytochrome c biogenesis protein CcdA [Vicinamibacterales bacterium]
MRYLTHSHFRASFLGVAFLLTPFSIDAQMRRPQANVTPVVETSGVHAGTTIRVALQVSLPDNLHVQSDRPRDPLLIPTTLTIEPPPGVTLRGTAFPPAIDLKQEGQAEPLAVFENTFAIGVELAVAESTAVGPLLVPARLRYQACDDQLCYPPATAQVEWRLHIVPSSTALTRDHADVFDVMKFATPAPIRESSAAVAGATSGDDGLIRLERFTTVATTGGYLSSDDFLQFIGDAESGVVQRGMFEGRGPIAIVLLVLLGGLALNLTPCVLPMIPINLAIIGAGAQAGSRRRGFLLGSAYGGAMALVYGALGLVVVLTAGTFGTINASPWFNAGIAALFIILGLAMFDVFDIDFSRFSSGFQGRNRGSIALAFTMGAVAALLAGACVAPVVIQVVLFSTSLYAKGTTLALALPFFLGVGMALPWPIAGAGLSRLPKPGPWMVRVKQAFGVLILGTAVYYGYLAYTLFADRWVDASAVTSSVEEKVKSGWHASLAEGLAVAEREQKPVLIDMWATWCKNCLTMDATTFKNPAVVSALEGYVKIKFQAEDPDAPDVRPVMSRFDAVGLPTYAILRPQRSASTALPGATQ